MDEANTRAVRAARNQALFREVNERVQQINDAFESLLPRGDWVCECADQGCIERLSLTHEEYEAVRANGARFVVAPHADHLFPEVEALVERHERYWVVEKVGTAADVVRQHERMRP
jgi:hypothetical protein